MPPTSYTLADGTKVPWIAFGTGTALYKKECADAVRLALSVGFTHIDAAQMYENEEYVGEAISSSNIPREELYVTTKLDKIPPGQTVEDTLRVSLKKLKVDYVDLFLVHVPTAHKDREGGLKQVWKEMVEAKAKGLTKSIGVSNFNKGHLEEVLSTGLEKPVVNQIEYHPLVATKLAPLLAYSRIQGITIASYGTLSPILPQRVTDGSLKPAVAKLVATLDSIAQSRGSGVTHNQILYKWLQAQEIIAVTTSSKESRLKENLATDSLPELTKEEINAIIQSAGGVHHRFFALFPYMNDE